MSRDTGRPQRFRNVEEIQRFVAQELFLSSQSRLAEEGIG